MRRKKRSGDQSGDPREERKKKCKKRVKAKRGEEAKGRVRKKGRNVGGERKKRV